MAIQRKVFPAAEQRDGMLSVAASTKYDNLASFSSYERGWVDVTAPGEEIVSALPGGRYGMWSGTSIRSDRRRNNGTCKS
ncbi:MAG: S8 family serine peptidase [Ignavibacteria bacterium]|nr:S8 family serine peptidase [Ignavibacteria bacterium]